jgi:hypothetical protein
MHSRRYRRAIFVIVVLLGIGVIVKSRSWYDFVPLAFWAIPLGVFVVYRMDLVKKAPSNEEAPDTSDVDTAALSKTFKLRQWLRQLWPRFLLLLRRAPFSDWFSLWPALVAFLFAIAGFVFGAL